MKVHEKVISPQTKEFQEKYRDSFKKQMEVMKEYLKQVSEILEKKTYLHGGWPQDYWLHIKEHLQTEIKSLKKHLEFLEKIKR